MKEITAELIIEAAREAASQVDHPLSELLVKNRPVDPDLVLGTRIKAGVEEGELTSFDDPEVRLPTTDRIEGFRPGLPSLYSRVLLAVRLAASWLIPAWAYVAVD